MKTKGARDYERLWFPVTAAAVIAGVLLSYSNAFRAPFLFDDLTNIVNNPGIRGCGGCWPPVGTRYVTYLSFSLNYLAGGLDPFGYHAVNIAIHAASALLAGVLTRQTLKTPAISGTVPAGAGFALPFAVSLVFALHPVQTQAITYVSQRFASLSALFYLSSIALWVEWRLGEGNRRAFYVCSLATALLAFKTKEVSATLPVMLLLYEAVFFGFKKKGFEKWNVTPFFIAALIVPLELFAPLWPKNAFDVEEILRHDQIRDLSTGSSYIYLINQFRVIAEYLRLLFLPAGQNLDYDWHVSRSFFEPRIFLSFLLLAASIAAAVYLFVYSRRKGSGLLTVVAFGIFWFFIALAVESSVIPVKDFIFEHRMYLPSVGLITSFFASIVYGIDWTGMKTGLVPAAIVIAVIIGVPLGAAAYGRNGVWGTQVSMHEDVVKKSPAKARARLGLGFAYYNSGAKELAMQEFKTALAIDPGYADARTWLGNIYFEAGDIDGALREFKASVAAKPGFAETRYNLGNAYYAKGDFNDALDEYRAAISINPGYAPAHLNIASAYVALGRFKEAYGHYKTFLAASDADSARYNPYRMNVELNMERLRAAGYGDD